MPVNMPIGTLVVPPPAPVKAADTPKRTPKGGRNKTVVRGAVGVAAFLAMAELLPQAGLVNQDYLPPLSAIIPALAAKFTESAFWISVGQTLTSWSLGLAVSTVAGVMAGIVLGSIKSLRDATHSTIEFLRPIPSVALIPLAVLVFGTNIQSTLLLVIYACFWQLLVQVLYGMQDIDPVALETSKSFRLRRMRVIKDVVLPTVLPYAVTGFRLAATIALVLAVTCELIIGAPGIGKSIAVAQASGAVPLMYGLVLFTGVLGMMVNLLVRFVERRVLFWHPSMRIGAEA